MRWVLPLCCLGSILALGPPGCAPAGGSGGGGGSVAGDDAVDNQGAISTDGADAVGGTGDVPADTDGDGVPDTQDAFPDDAAESTDTDGDGQGDNADPDDDGDGVPDQDDPAPDDDAVFTLTAPINPYAAPAGEPVSGLTQEASQQFASGQTLFQQRFVAGEGLGLFAAVASCTQCHGGDTPASAGGLHEFRFAGGDGGQDTLVQRNVAPLFGLGLLETVSDDEILLRQDPFDLDGDGISGRANLDGQRVGRYGRKAQAATVESIVRGMLINQMGLTSEPIDGEQALGRAPDGGFWKWLSNLLAGLSLASPAYAQVSPPDTGGDGSTDDDFIPDPEIGPADLRDLLVYVLNLAAPPRGPIDLAVDRGQGVFESIGCADCHTSTLTTAENLPIYPYSDLLLHDMGPSLADGLTLGAADGSEFRTQPLWGLAAAAPYLHDGRAETLEQAIAEHGGEAQPSRDAFDALDADQHGDLIRFLESL